MRVGLHWPRRELRKSMVGRQSSLKRRGPRGMMICFSNSVAMTDNLH